MKVLNFGSLNIDYTYQVDHFVRAGETMSSESLQVFSGGKGLNQSIALSKAGAKVWHAGAVGAGDGDFLIEQMKKAGVHTELIEHLDGQTGHAIIQKDPAGQNCILLYGGANQRITKEMVDRIEATKDPQALMNGLVKRFPEAKIVLTLGGDGSVYRDGDTVLRQGIYKVPVVDTTAAGDTFTGYFIGGLQLGEDPKTALEHAAKAAAIAVSRPGAAPSVPNREEVETFEG